ncbi:endonuclease MutS2 [Haploplasma axanthum]|uniref:Endonuclease MutS2 n=1 Tax=Haploplasma axanthum TaxID=29552 RepID=A0A449BEB0_HAPAX|nr:endonuclease MutS2 [Haploplasma axanthum]VEU80793.1 MutS2 protein [Haploplasma axanthum]
MSFSTKTLEFDAIKTQVQKYAYSEITKNRIEEMLPETNLFKINKITNETNEILKIVARFGTIPFLENFDNNILSNDNILERVYSLEELLYLRLYLIMEQNITNYFLISKEFKLEYVTEKIKFNDHLRLLSILNQTFTDYGEIFDDASKELKRLRTLIKKLQLDLETKLQKLLNTYQDYLSENIIVTRNGRYCLAVKEGSKNKVKGVIHDVSSSRQTVFIEPELSLHITAEIELNKILEEKEITKILTIITQDVNKNFESLKENFSKFIELDLIHAKAKYSLATNGILPRLNNQGRIKLINGKHPLLDQKIAVPISLELDKNNNILLITGPNTGGKTVALKTIGLLTIMLQSGILIPVNEESEIAVFDNIFADIGDEQSIINSLSTFSSHIARVIKFLNTLTDNSLILLDELGSGTDPIEGVALAIAIIEEFNKKDIRLVVTSHYSELKTYAYESEGILTASVAFDKDSLKPLYYLQHGISGDSHARLIAKRLGMNDSVIEKANYLYARKETDLSKIIGKLNEEKKQLEIERKRLSDLEGKYNFEKDNLELTRKKLIDEQNTVIDQIRKKELEKWQEKEIEVQLLIEEIENNKNVKEHHIADLKGKISEKPHKDISYDKTKTFNVGDQVYIKSYQQYGIVKEKKDNKYRVKFGIFDLEFKLSDLEMFDSKKKVEKKEIKKVNKNQNKHDVSTSSSMRVDLRGFRFEDVHDELDKAIDKALISNLHSLTIIHGFGTGAVRKAVYDYIAKSKLIASHRYGQEGEGLNGVTVITLK